MGDAAGGFRSHAQTVSIPRADLSQQRCPQMGVQGEGAPEGGISVLRDSARPVLPLLPEDTESGGNPEVLFRAVPRRKSWNVDLVGFF